MSIDGCEGETEPTAPFVSFTHETFGLHFGSGVYFVLAETSETVTGIHVSPAGITLCTYATGDPFETLHATTFAWRSVQSFSLHLPQDASPQVTLDTTGANVVWEFAPGDAETARGLHRALLVGLAAA